MNHREMVCARIVPSWLVGVAAVAFCLLLPGQVAMGQQDLPSANPADWAALDMPSLVKTAEAICMTDKYTADDRSAIANYVTQKYADASKQADFNVKGWVYLVGVVGPNLADPLKQTLAQQIADALTPNAQAIAQLSDAQIVQAANALWSLGARTKPRPPPSNG